MLAACTSESENGPSANISYESIAATQQVPVTFGTYIGETPVTRAGTPGSIEDDGTANDAPAVLGLKGGFGVFAYYTFTGTWDSATGATDNGTYGGSAGTQITNPNFMYNQQVTGATTGTYSVDQATAWSYTPLKYWPNDYASGDVDTNPTNAQGSKVSKVSFFAYAPYVATASATGPTGITTFTSNATPGDPKVSYTVASTPDASVDLLWGVAGSSGDNTAGVANPIVAGKPIVNQTKQELDGKVSFKFDHALSRLGLTVQAAKDKVAAGSNDGNELWDATAANKTRIYINSVTISTTMYMSAVLNLNNTTADVAEWEFSGAAAATTLTVQDVTTPSVIKNLNPDLVMDTSKTLDDGAQKPGVRAIASATPGALVPTPVMQHNGEDVYFMLIPQDLSTATGTDQNITIVIDYDVKTLDANLAGGMSSVNNRITKVIGGIKFESGKAYNLNLVLGMNSVDITATVANWGAGTDHTVDLPINVN